MMDLIVSVPDHCLSFYFTCLFFFSDKCIWSFSCHMSITLRNKILFCIMHRCITAYRL